MSQLQSSSVSSTSSSSSSSSSTFLSSSSAVVDLSSSLSLSSFFTNYSTSTSSSNEIASSSTGTNVSPTTGLFSTNAVFLATIEQIYVQITIWTVVGCAFVFLCAALHAARVHTRKQYINNYHYDGDNSKHGLGHLQHAALSNSTGITVLNVLYLFVLLPLFAAFFGGFIGFLQGSITAALIGALANSISSLVGVDIAAGLGLGQAIVICYFHLGRADFIHR